MYFIFITVLFVLAVFIYLYATGILMHIQIYYILTFCIFFLIRNYIPVYYIFYVNFFWLFIINVFFYNVLSNVNPMNFWSVLYITTNIYI